VANDSCDILLLAVKAFKFIFTFQRLQRHPVTKIKFLPINNGCCQSVDRQNLSIHNPHTCPVAADTCVADADCQTATHGCGVRDHQQSHATVGADSVAVMQMCGWSGCWCCSLLGRASAATAASCHRLAITPFTQSNDLIIVIDMHCSSNTAVACECMYASVFLWMWSGTVVCDIVRYLWATIA